MTTPSRVTPPGPWLVADIGGTHARFGWLGPGSPTAEEVQSLVVAEHDGPVAAARSYLEFLARRRGDAYRPPRAAAFAVATAVTGDRIALTNARWAFSCRATQAALGLERLQVLNDFEALALSLPRLAPPRLLAIGERQVPADPGAARAVIGPGTGLGVAGLVPSGGGWVALPGEGGHATLAPADEFESALLALVRREHSHVSAERLLSGSGLPLLHRCTAQLLDRRGEDLTAAAIVERALAGQDPVAGRTLELFCTLLGGFAGNVALILGARGGVYIGGGIVPRISAYFSTSPFRARFESKGRFAGYLREIPTFLITDTLAALDGAAAALGAPPGAAVAAP